MRWIFCISEKDNKCVALNDFCYLGLKTSHGKLKQGYPRERVFSCKMATRPECLEMFPSDRASQADSAKKVVRTDFSWQKWYYQREGKSEFWSRLTINLIVEC